jgi:hypothetical protein
MTKALEGRLTRLEARGDQASRKFVIVGNETEREAVIRAGCLPDGAVVIITGVSRSPRGA